MSQRKRSVSAWLAYQPLRFILSILGLLPFRWRSHFGGWVLKGPIGRLIGYRKRVLRNLNHVMGHLTPAEHDAIADSTLENAGRTFVENLYPADFARQVGTIELWGDGIDAMMEAHAQGRSIQFVSGHFGNHEAFRLALYHKGIKVGGIYRPLSNPFFNDFYVETLKVEGRAGPIFPTGRDGTTAYLNALRNGGVALVLLVDVASTRAEKLEFMGKPAYSPTSAAAFALKADALFLPYFSMRHGNDHKVEIAAPIEHSDQTTMTLDAFRLLEDRITADPGNWFWVHKRWKPDA